MIPDALLLEFRAAAEIEHRLLDLEHDIEKHKVMEAVWLQRLARLIALKPKLEAHRAAVVKYFLAVEAQP